MGAVGASNDPLVGRAAESVVANERLRHLEAITEAALAHLKLDDLLDELLDRLVELLGVDTAAVLLLEEATDDLVACAARGIEEEVEQGVRIPLGQGFAGRVAGERRPIFLPDVSKAEVLNPLLREKGIASLLGVPMLVGSRVVGVVHVGTLAPREFTAEDADLLQIAADRMALAIDHARLYEAERDARLAAERAVERIRQIQSVTDVALGHFSLEEPLLLGLLERVTEVLAADTAAILLLDGEGKELVARAGKGIEEEVERGVRIPMGGGFAGRIAAERRPVIIARLKPGDVLNPLLLEKGIRSLLGVPLMVEGRVIGVLHIGTLTPRDFTAEDVELLELAADRIAVAIDRARQHSVARALQESLLPARLPEFTPLDLAARYVASADDAHVGGDWYDVLRLPGGRAGLVMGDVVSRGARAAAAMGHLRTALRAFAHDGASPAVVLERLNEFVRAGEDREMATIAYAVLDPASGELAYSLAGHPPPLVLGRDGGTRFLEGGRCGPVAVVSGARFVEARDTLEPGDTLVLYTDGLVERRDASLDDGLEDLELTAREVGGRPEELCEQLIARLGVAHDDTAVLAVRLATVPDERLELHVRATPESLSAMRRSLGVWLTAAGADEDEAYDVVVAVGEAAANAVEHAYGPVEEEFLVEGDFADGEVRLTVSDNGRWRPRRGANRGRGLDLMRKLMDGVEVESGEGGTVVSMRRRVGAGGER